MVYRGKELPYVAFEHPNRARVIMRYLIGKGAKAIYRLVPAFISSARVRVGNESPIKKWVELAVERVMQQTVSHARLMYVPWLWVGNVERLIRRMFVCFGSKVSME